MSEAKHSPLSLRDALRASPCPRPANGERDDLTTGECFDKSQCGCQNGASLEAATSLHHELVAALEETTRHLEDAQSGFIPMSGSDEAWTKKQGEIVADARALLQKAKQGDKQ